MTSPLTSLRERVEAAGGPDRELSHDIVWTLWPIKDRANIREIEGTRQFRNAAGVWLNVGPYFWDAEDEVTTSIDAALALVKESLPDANCYGFDATPSRVDGYVSRNNVSEGHWYYENRAKTPALAICAALLRALEARERGE